MSGTTSARSDKNKKNLSLATVKDEFASSSAKRNRMVIEYEILKENHETLIVDYESLQERLKHVEETYEIMKKLLQGKAKELEKDCERERSEKEKYKKMFEDMKVMESERKDMIDELRTRNEELLLARKKGKEDVEYMENKFIELAEKFGVVETECSFLKSLYDAEVAASGTVNPVISGFGETENLIGLGGNEVNNSDVKNEMNSNVNNDVTDSILVIDDSDDEQDNPPRESKISTQGSVDRRSQEEQCKNKANSSNGNQEIFPPRAINSYLPPLSPSSSSSSSDGYEVVVKLPADWPEWAMPKGPGGDSNKS